MIRYISWVYTRSVIIGTVLVVLDVCRLLFATVVHRHELAVNPLLGYGLALALDKYFHFGVLDAVEQVQFA